MRRLLTAWERRWARTTRRYNERHRAPVLNSSAATTRKRDAA